MREKWQTDPHWLLQRGKASCLPRRKRINSEKKRKIVFSSFGEYRKVEKKNSKQSLTDNTKDNFDTDFKGTQNVNKKP